MASEGNVLDKLQNLCDEMAKGWNEEQFFSGMMTTFDTAGHSISMALKAAEDPNDRTVYHGLPQGASHTDLAIPRRAYFRFLKEDGDVRPAVSQVQTLPEFENSKNAYRYIICASPRNVCVWFREEDRDEMLSVRMDELPMHYTYLMGIDPAYKPPRLKETNTLADVRACRKLNVLLDNLMALNGIKTEDSHKMHVFVCRVLFCLFAEDTGIFEQDQFEKAFASHVGRDGSGAQRFFEELFLVLDTADNKRAGLPKTISAGILKFPYVNGAMFSEKSYIPRFDATACDQLLNCCSLQWHEVSPAVFGAMFQGSMEQGERRQMGAHYTPEDNIMLLIRPLFLDRLREEFSRLQGLRPGKDKEKKLHAFHERIASLRFLDPACGCGNFLIMAYRELRRLENDIIREIYGTKGLVLDERKVSMDHFYGIEIEDWPAQIAHISMYLMEHVMNLETNKLFHTAFPTIPLKRSVAVVAKNALTHDWNRVLPASECDYILGNPPFGGTTYTSDEQKKDLKNTYPKGYKTGLADYCTAWFVKAASYMEQNSNIRTALVSTNSICQGEQVGTLWGLLLEKGIRINFACTSFPWHSEARGAATVTCIITGFSYLDDKKAVLYSGYEDSRHGFANRTESRSITPYLTPSKKESAVIVRRASEALSAPYDMTRGNLPADGGFLIFEKSEGEEFLGKYPECARFVKKYIGSSELMKSAWRYCLWLEDKDRDEWSANREIMRRVEGCRNFRLKSQKAATKEDAKTPWRFQEVKPLAKALVMPVHTSERRLYIPTYLIINSKDHIISNANMMIPNADEYVFGIISSRMHNCWLRLTAGRLKSDYRYSRDLVYNTFIWPEADDSSRAKITELAGGILDIRELHYDMELGSMYNPESMPGDLLEAHQKLDLAVEQAYRKEPFEDDEERSAFLLDLYSRAIEKQKQA